MRYFIVNRGDDYSRKMANAILSKLKKDDSFSIDENNPEFVIVVGGDGTFLNALHNYAKIIDDVKFLCFNTGTIGYYNEFSIDNYKKVLDGIKKGKFGTKGFSLIEYQSQTHDFLAVNEFIISGLSKNVEYDIYLDGEKLEQYFGMGLVVSSSTGSMGYNRSINGAIVDIDCEGMELTEVAPIRSKAYSPIGSPIVLGPNRVLTFKEINDRPGVLLQDNIPALDMADKEFSIKLSAHKVTCYSIEKDPFLSRLKKTLGF